MNHKKILIFILALFATFPVFSQKRTLPTIVPSKTQASENVEAVGVDANYKKPGKLFSCHFSDYQVNLKTTGENNFLVELNKNIYHYAGMGGVYTETKKIMNGTTYDGNTYVDFLENFVQKFVEEGEGRYKFSLTNNNSEWFNSFKGIKNVDVYVNIKAKAQERSSWDAFWASAGCVLSEAWELTCQSWNYIISSDNVMTDITFLQMNNYVQIALAGKYKETLSGNIKIGNTTYNFSSCSGDKLVPHYIKKNVKKN